MTLIQGFAVQQWMQQRRSQREPETIVAKKGSEDRWADLQLIFNHLDTSQRGTIRLRTISNALSMVELSEDPARHDQLSKSIVSCFNASGHPKSTGRAIDFTQFADVMAFRENGRKFTTLQDELTSEGLAAAKAHFANIFRREVVRGLLDGGGTAGFMCATFQTLFQAKGLAASLSDRVRKVQLIEEAAKTRKIKTVESERAAQAKQRLLESSRSGTHNTRHFPAHVSSPPSSTYAPRSGDMLNAENEVATSSATGVIPLEAVKEQSELHPIETRVAAREVRQRRGHLGMFERNIGGSNRAEISIRLKKQAVRQVSAVLGLHYVPTPPSTENPATRMADAFRRRGWALGGSRAGCSAGDTRTMISVVAGGFVRYPTARVRQLRRSGREGAPPASSPRGKRSESAMGSTTTDPANPENKSAYAFGILSRRKDAILKRTLLCGRLAMARLPLWASCDNSACDPWTTLPPRQHGGTSTASSAGRSFEGGRGLLHTKLMSCTAGASDSYHGTDSATGLEATPTHVRVVEAPPPEETSLEEEERQQQNDSRAAGANTSLGTDTSAGLGASQRHTRDIEAAPPEATSLEEEEWWPQNDSRFTLQKPDSLSSTASHMVKTIAATTPTTMRYPPLGPPTHAVARKTRTISRNASSSSSISLATNRDTIRLDGSDAEHRRPAGRVAKVVGLPSRPANNPTGKVRRKWALNGNGFGRRGDRVGGGANTEWPPPTPWRAPNIVRRMRRPERLVKEGVESSNPTTHM